MQACLFQGTARTASHLGVAVSNINTWRRNRDFIVKQVQESGSVSKLRKDFYFKIIPFLYIQDPFGIFGSIKYFLLSIVGIFKPIIRGPIYKKALFELVTKSTALACENFMLAIVAQNYGCCPMEGFDEVRVKKLLNLNSKSHVVMVIGIEDIDPAGIFGL